MWLVTNFVVATRCVLCIYPGFLYTCYLLFWHSTAPDHIIFNNNYEGQRQLLPLIHAYWYLIGCVWYVMTSDWQHTIWLRFSRDGAKLSVVVGLFRKKISLQVWRLAIFLAGYYELNGRVLCLRNCRDISHITDLISLKCHHFFSFISVYFYFFSSFFNRCSKLEVPVTVITVSVAFISCWIISLK